MNAFKTLLMILAALLLVAGFAAAQDGINARAAGMGNSSFGVLGGSEAIYLNPAALPWLERNADGNEWGGQAFLGFGSADAEGPAARVSNQGGWTTGVGVTNGRYGLGAYYSDVETLEDDRRELALGYGFRFGKRMAAGVMLRQLERTIGEDVQVTDFTLLYNLPRHEQPPISFTLAIRDPYEHDEAGLMFDLAIAGKVADKLLLSVYAFDLTEQVHRLMNIGAEFEVKPGWFARAGFFERPAKRLQGLSLGVGHKMGNWQVDLAISNLQSNIDNTDLDTGVTLGGSYLF